MPYACSCGHLARRVEKSPSPIDLGLVQLGNAGVILLDAHGAIPRYCLGAFVNAGASTRRLWLLQNCCSLMLSRVSIQGTERALTISSSQARHAAGTRGPRRGCSASAARAGQTYAPSDTTMGGQTITLNGHDLTIGR